VLVHDVGNIGQRVSGRDWFALMWCAIATPTRPPGGRSGSLGECLYHPACSRRPPRPKLEIPAVTSWRGNVDTSFAADTTRTMDSWPMTSS